MAKFDLTGGRDNKKKVQSTTQPVQLGETTKKVEKVVEGLVQKTLKLKNDDFLILEAKLVSMRQASKDGKATWAELFSQIADGFRQEGIKPIE